MILQLDVGNTRIKWRVKAQGSEAKVVARGVLTHEQLESLGEALPLGRLSVAELSNVASADRRDALVSLLEERCGIAVREAKAQPRQGTLTNSYRDAGAMGVDRWLAMLAANECYPGGVAVVDAGSALTVDFVAASGEHLGGYILPGVSLMERALKQDTARVPFRSEADTSSSPGRSTQACVSGGLAWHRAAVMRQLRDDMARYGLKCLVLTGGDAALMCRQEDAMTVIAPDLVLDGLNHYGRLMWSDSMVPDK